MGNREALERLCGFDKVDPKPFLNAGVTCPEYRKFQDYHEKYGLFLPGDPRAGYNHRGDDFNRIPAGSVTWGSTASEKKNDAMADAICMGNGIRIERPQPGYQDFEGSTLTEVSRETLRDSGLSDKGNIHDIIGRAMSTGDFPAILQNVSNKSLLSGFEEAEETHERWTIEVPVRDFKLFPLVSMAGIDGLLPVPEHGEFVNGYMADKSESLTLAAAGRIYPITRQAIINDDQGAIVATFKAAGRRAKAYEADLVYALLAANPVMQEDGQQLFSAAHANQATVIGVPSAATLDDMDALFGAQVDQFGTALNVPVRYIICPRTMKGTADSFLATIQYVAASGDLQNNTWTGGRIEPIYESRLNATPNTWYAAGPKGTTVVIAHLSGHEKPYTEIKEMWNMDAIGLKVRFDVAAGVADFRGLARNQ